MSKTAIISIIILSLALIPSTAEAQRRKGKSKSAAEVLPSEPAEPFIVARAISGDLIQLTSGHRVRLSGADAPVIPDKNRPGQEPWASEARKFTENLALNKEISIRSVGYKTDQYGRIFGIVYVGDVCLDCELIKQGFAMVQSNQNLDNQTKLLLVEAQSEALRNKQGIWNPENRLPLPPREFRAANGLSEGDDSKADSWKKASSPAAAPPLKEKADKRNGKDGNSSSPSGSPALPGAAGGLQAGAQMLDALVKIQSKINGGVKSGELSRLVDETSRQFDSMINSGNVDRALARDLKDALDSYKLALEAFKRKENSPTEEGPKYSKFIDGALEIAEKSIASASKRLDILIKSRK